MLDDETSPYDYDEEIILQIGDFYPEDDHTMESVLTSAPNTWPGDPTSLLINGQSGRGRLISNKNDGDSACEPWTMNVTAGKTYRIRVIGTTTISLVLFGIADHDNLTIIETDNSYVVPIETSYMQIDTGQRFSFLLKTKEQSELQELGGYSKFWIEFATREGQNTIYAYGVLNYVDFDSQQGVDVDATCDFSADSAVECSVDSPTAPILDLPQTVTNWLEYTFINPPLSGYDAPPNASEVTRRIILNTAQVFNATYNVNMMKVDGESWFADPPLGPTNQIPALVEILQNGTINGHVPGSIAADYGGELDLSQTYPAAIGEVLELVWQNEASTPGGIWGPHPLHAHGGPYWDMGSGPGTWDPAVHEELLQNNSVNGLLYPGSRRDTTILYKYAFQGDPGTLNGWRVWRIRVTEKNVGVWMIHCHILQHIVMGQTTVWVFGTPDQVKAHIVPVNETLEGYFTYGGNVTGKTGQEERGMVVAHFFDD